MLLTYFNLAIISLIIFGFSSFKKIVINDFSSIKNEDFIFGITAISFIALIGNFFLPLNLITPFIIIIGLLLFIINNIKNKFDINFLNFFVILFLFCFFTHNNSLNYDSPFYHLQIIKWSSEYKISFGLVNLEPRYAMPSIWHQFLALFNYNFFEFNPIYLVSIIIFSIFLNKVVNLKNFQKLSNIYLLFVNCFLLLFALIHPFKDGIIFNHLGSPESDIIGIVFFSFSFYFFLKIVDEKKIVDFYYLLFFVFYGVLTKISYAYLVFLLFSSLIIFKSEVLKNKKVIILLFTITIVWFVRNLIISGCLIFPISLTCIDFSWANIDDVDYFFNEAKSWSRSTRLRTNAANFEITLYSFDWFLPWFKDYFVNTSILKALSISFALSFTFVFFGIILKKIKFKSIINKYNFIILIFVFLGIYSWLQAPEVRYGHGLIILSISFNMIIVTKILKLNFKRSLFRNLLYLLLVFLCLKNYQVFSVFNEKFVRKYTHSKFIKVNNSSDYEIFSPNPDLSNISGYQNFCTDFNGICGYLNHPTKLENLKITKNKFGNFVFKN